MPWFSWDLHSPNLPVLFNPEHEGTVAHLTLAVFMEYCPRAMEMPPGALAPPRGS